MKNSSRFGTFLLIFLFVAKPAHSHEAIVGGEKVAPHDPIAASTVAIMMDKNKTGKFKFHCTASLIDEHHLLTAAHCVCPNAHSAPPVIKPSLLKIFFGTETTHPTHQIDVLQIKIHPDYQGYYDPDRTDLADLAVLELAEAIPSEYHPAKVLRSDIKLFTNETVILAGFGRTSMNMFNTMGTLRKVETNILKPDFGKTEVELDQSKGKGACFGDSGGPAFILNKGKLLLWGVTNHLYPQGVNTIQDCAHQIIYSNLNAHLDFIKEAVAKTTGF